jgi:hypothetical protein
VGVSDVFRAEQVARRRGVGHPSSIAGTGGR